MKGLADMLIKGEGTAADPERAVKLLEQAAKAGLKGPVGGALGDYYRRIRDYKKASDALEQAVAAGDGWAMVGLAHMLIKGEGVHADHVRARTLLESAAKQKQIAAAYIELIALAAGPFQDEYARRSALSLLREAYATDTRIALDAFNRLSQNSRVAILQLILNDAALYPGPINGFLTADTRDILSRFCSSERILGCRFEPMPMPLFDALLMLGAKAVAASELRETFVSLTEATSRAEQPPSPKTKRVGKFHAKKKHTKSAVKHSHKRKKKKK
jgi:tetratricopeptide (TPR) repeat protein